MIAVSGSIARRLTAVDRVAAKRTTAIPNAIPRADHQSREPDPLGRRFAPGDLIIGTVARLVPEKGVSWLVRAAPLILREQPRTRFVIVGDGPLRAELIALADALGISARVRFLGARVDGPQLIAELDVLAVPSLSNEGTPLVMLEALSAGIPVVASAVGGIPEQVRGFDRTTLVPPGDMAALTRALVDMSRTVRRRTASSGREIRLLPGHEAMVRETEAVYAKAYAESLRRAPRAVGALAPRWLAR